MFTKTYEMALNSPSPMNWIDYKGSLHNQWLPLLNAHNLPESQYQSFFEENPCMLPGAHGLALISGHSPYYSGVFTQPPLPGFNKKYPDFMWIATFSDEINPVLIEIEKPSKNWFTKKGIQSSDLTEALNQLTEWKTWFDSPTNIHQFRDLYLVNDQIDLKKKMVPLFVLIYGRREEANRFQEKRANLKRQNEYIMTYDRLKPQKDQSNYICIKRAKEGFVAINVPVTLMLGPLIAGPWKDVRNIEKAIENNNLISQERKDFLNKRIRYWLNWAKQGEKGIISTGDWE